MTIEEGRAIAEIVRAVVTSLGIVLGIVGSVLLFFRKRQRFPRATVEHVIEHVSLGPRGWLLRVNVVVSNIAEILLSLEKVETKVHQILPLPSDVPHALDVGWPRVDVRERDLREVKCEVEPGESQDIDLYFELGQHVQVVEVNTHVSNKKKRKRNIGWDVTSLYKFCSEKTPVLKEKEATMSEERAEKQRTPKPDPGAGSGERQRQPKPVPQPAPTPQATPSTQPAQPAQPNQAPAEGG